MIHPRVVDFWVGVFVVLGILSVLFLSLGSITGASSKVYIVLAEFDNVGGLKVRAPVRSAGVTVGRVTAIDLNTENYKAKVTMEIDSSYDFSSDTSARILTSGLLGEKYIGLTEGAMSDTIRETGVIDITSSALVLEDLIGRLTTSILERR